MMRWLALAGVLVAFVAVWQVAADDAPGCDGLEAYREAMLAAAEPMVTYLEVSGFGDANPLTVSSAEWLVYADEALAFNERLLAIEPPEWAADFHRLQLDTTGMQEQVGRTVAESGVMALLLFEDTVNDIEERKDSVPAAIAETCPDFASFSHEWDALDGEIDGTPVATPVR